MSAAEFHLVEVRRLQLDMEIVEEIVIDGNPNYNRTDEEVNLGKFVSWR